MKKRFYQSLLLAAVLLPMFYSSLLATAPDTLWTRRFGDKILGAPEEGFEFHPTNDSIFIFTGRTFYDGVETDTFAVHFVNTITGQEYLRYGPIHEAHYTPDGNFLIGHNDSTIAYISLDSMKPVRTYPIVDYGVVDFTIDEKGKNAYSSIVLTTDTGRIFGFFRWDIENGTVQRIDLPDSLLDIGVSSCPIERIVIENMYVSDTAKILLMQIFVDRPLPFCPAERRIWGIDLNADTVKYDFTKIHPTYESSSLEKIMPKRTQFIGKGWKYENYEKYGYRYIFDVATGAEIRDMPNFNYYKYCFSTNESYLIISSPEGRIFVFDFGTQDTVYTYNNTFVGQISISPNNEFILQHASTKFALYSAPWYPTSIINPGDKNPEMYIYPNPASDYIEIFVPRWRGQGVDICIFDILGTKVTTPNLTPGPSPRGEGSKVRVDVSALAPGVYFVRVGDFVGRFVKY